MHEFTWEDLLVTRQDEAERLVESRLAPEQRALTYGDHWARFDAPFLVFGLVAPLDQIPGVTDWEHRNVEDRQRHGYLYGPTYSVIEDGDWQETHRGHVWPIPQTMFEAMRLVGWDAPGLEVDMMMALMVHHRAWHAHIKTVAS